MKSSLNCSQGFMAHSLATSALWSNHTPTQLPPSSNILLYNPNLKSYLKPKCNFNPNHISYTKLSLEQMLRECTIELLTHSSVIYLCHFCNRRMPALAHNRSSSSMHEASLPIVQLLSMLMPPLNTKIKSGTQLSPFAVIG